MSRSDSTRENCLLFIRGYTFLIIVQFLMGLMFFMSSPVMAASDPLSSTEPRLEWLTSFGPPLEGGSFSIITSADGGAVAGGCLKVTPERYSLYLIKTDTKGNNVWELTDPESSPESCSVIETPEKGYLVAGSSNNSITNGIFLKKFDPSGKKLWTQEFNKGEYYYGNDISITREGGFIITGSVFRNTGPQSSLWDGYIIKTDAEGKELWTGFFNGEKNDFAGFIRQTEDGGYIIAGTTESYGTTGGQYPYLLKMNEFGNKEWFAAYENGPGTENLSVIQKPDGGYIVLGSSSVTPYQQDPDLFLIGTDDRGKELWRKNYSGIRGATGNLVNRDTGSIVIITGSPPRSEAEKDGKIILLDIDLDGNEKRYRIFNIGQPVDRVDIAYIQSEGYFVTGLLPVQGNPERNRMTLVKVLDSPLSSVVPVKNSFDLSVITKDAQNGAFIGEVQVYLDGGSVGTTTEHEGKLTLSEVDRGSHTIRVAKSGYAELTRPVAITEKRQVSFTLNRSNVIPLQIHGSTGEKIDIVFVASETSFSCNSKTKIQTEVYTGDQQRFVTDVHKKIDNVFLALDTLTSSSVGLPEGFRERYNFYYYWDTGSFADAFDGCSGTLPDDFWNDAPFTDVAIILYPTYEGYYSGSPCEPNGCANGLGPGSGSWLKAPADSPMIFLHESGHVVFGLIDTYCGDTYYVENSPFPNVWSSESSCKKNAEKADWDSATCRQIFKPAGSRMKEPCMKNFWRADPDPDIMGSGAYSGRFGNASTSRIRYIFDTINRWQK